MCIYIYTYMICIVYIDMYNWCDGKYQQCRWLRGTITRCVHVLYIWWFRNQTWVCRSGQKSRLRESVWVISFVTAWHLSSLSQAQKIGGCMAGRYSRFWSQMSQLLSTMVKHDVLLVGFRNFQLQSLCFLVLPELPGGKEPSSSHPCLWSLLPGWSFRVRLEHPSLVWVPKPWQRDSKLNVFLVNIHGEIAKPMDSWRTVTSEPGFLEMLDSQWQFSGHVPPPFKHWRTLRIGWS